MIKNRFFLTLAVCGSVLAAPVAGPAKADSLIQPQGKWSIIRATQGGGDYYCTMARQYQNRTILTFAETKDNEYSVAIDFQDVTLQTQKPYSVTLQAGGGQLRSFEVVPNSAKAMVAPVGPDDKFWTALAAEKTMAVRFEGKAYRFALAGWGGARQELKACLGNEKPEKIVQQNKPGPAAKVQPAKMAATQSPVTKTPKRNPLLNAASASADAAFEAQKVIPVREVVPIPPQPEPIASPVPQKTASAVEAKKPQKQTGASAKAEQSSAKQKAQILKYMKEIERLSQENKKLERQVSSLQKANSSLQQDTEDAARAQVLESRLVEMRKNRDALEGALREAKDKLAAQAKIEDKPESEQIMEYKSNLRKLEAQLGSLRAENAALTTQVSDLRQTQEETRLASAAGDWDAQKALQRFNEAEREIRRMGLRLEQEKAACSSEKSELEAMLFDPAVAESTQIKRLLSLEQQLRETDTQLGKQQAQCDQNLREARAGYDRETMGLEVKVTALESKLRQEEARVAELQKAPAPLAAEVEELKKLRARVVEQAGKTQQDEAKIASLEQKLANQTKMTQEIEARFTETVTETQQRDEKIALLEQRLSAQSKMLEGAKGLQENLAKQQEKSQQDAQQIASLEQKLTEQAKVIEGLKGAEGKLAEFIDKAEQDKKKIARLEERLTNQSLTLQAMKDGEKAEAADLKELASLKEKVAEKIAQEERQAAEMKKLHEQLVAKSEQAQKAADKVAHMEERLKEQAQAMSELKIAASENKGADPEMVRALQDQLAAKIRQAEEDAQKIIDLQAGIEKQAQESAAKIAELQASLDHQSQELVALKQTPKPATRGLEELASLRKQLADQDAKSQEAAAEMAQLQVQAAEKEEQSKKAEIRIANLEERLRAQSEAMALLKDEAARPKSQNPEITAQLQAMQQKLAQADQKAKADAEAMQRLEERIAVQSIAIHTPHKSASQQDKLLIGEQQTKISRLEKQLSEQERAIAALQAAPRPAPQELAELEILRAEVAQKDQLLIAQRNAQPSKEVQQQLASFQQEIAALRKQLDAVNDQNIILRNEVDRARLSLQQTQSGHSVQLDQVAALNLEIETMRKHLALKENELRAFRNQASILQQDVTQLEARLNQTEGMRERHHSAATDTQRKLNEAQVQMAHMRRTIDSLTATQEDLRNALSMTAPAAARDHTPKLRPPAVEVTGFVEPGSAPASQASGFAPRQVAPNTPISIEGIRMLLSSAGVAPQGRVKKTTPFSNNVESAYRWQAADTDGYAEIRRLPSASSFDRFVDDYTQTAKSRCNGDFASVPMRHNQSLVIHDMACVSATGDTASSVMFFANGDSFITISHEADAGGIDTAMDIRDRLVQTATQNKARLSAAF